jgi:pimeloyl-ACP methyl ester carboxylesterase
MGATLLLWLSAMTFFFTAVFIAAKWFERKNMFAPTAEHLLTPQGVGLPDPSEIFIESGGAKLHAWHFKKNVLSPTLLYIHGNAGNIADRLPVIKGYLKIGLNVLIYDPRGYGKSYGRQTEKNFVADAVAAYRHLVQKCGIYANNIILLGQSLGGIAALKLANSEKCKGLILEGTFVSVPQLARDLYPTLPVWMLASRNFNNENEVRKLKIPVLFICGTLDATIPHHHTKRLYESAHEPRELIVIEGAGHTDMYLVAPDIYYGAIARFVK